MSRLRLILAGGGVQELRLAGRLAQEAGAQVRIADHAAEALAFARAPGGDLLIADLGCNVPDLIAALRRERIAIPVLACAVDPPAALAVAAVRAGAIDFLPLPPSRELIAAALLMISERRRDLVGAAPAWRQTLALAERAASMEVPLLILGAPGTGKRTLAAHVHNRSGRKGPQVIVDGRSGGAPAELRSEIFGHRAGAFDGAVADRSGKWAEAAGGTLLLHHAEALAPDVQRDLARLAKASDPRLILTAASRDDVAPELADLPRLVEMRLPPLAERAGDVEALAYHFAARCAAEEGLAQTRFSAEAMARLRAHRWPRNVAELEQVVRRAVILTVSRVLGADDLALEDQPSTKKEAPTIDFLVGRSMEEVERALILGTLARCAGNRTSASAILGISVRTMRNKLRAFQEEGHAIAPAA